MSTDDRWEPEDEGVRPVARAGAEDSSSPSMDLSAVQETDAWFERLARRTHDEADQDDDLTALFIDLTDEIDGSSASRATERLRATMGERPVWVLGLDELDEGYEEEPVASADVFPRFAVGAVPHPPPARRRKPGVHTSVTRWAPVVGASAAVLVFFTSGVSVAMGNAPTLPMSKVSDAVSRLTDRSGPATSATRTTSVAATVSDAEKASKDGDRARTEELIKAAREGLPGVSQEQVAQLQARIESLEQSLASATAAPTVTATSGTTPTGQPSTGPTSDPTDTGSTGPTATDSPTDSPTGSSTPTETSPTTSDPTGTTTSPSPTSSTLLGTAAPTATATS